jgi:uncharacterized protein
MKDPVCGMEVNKNNAIKVALNGKEYFFCSAHCKDKFLKEQGAPDAAVCVPQAKKNFWQNKLFIVAAIAAVPILVSFFIPLLVPFRTAFLMYVKTVWWAVTLGLLLGGLIDYYVPREYISKVLSRKKPLTIFNAVFLGFLMSACSHGILALTIQLHKKGASNPAVVAFLLASPWANMAITIMLLSFFGLKALFIILAAIVIAINTGFIFMFLEAKGLIEKNMNTLGIAEDFSILKDIRRRAKEFTLTKSAGAEAFKGIAGGSLALADMVVWWILLGMLLASLAAAFIPVHFFHRFMGPSVLGLMVTLALATVIEICSEGSSPLAFEIYRQTGALGNSFVFLMAGVVTDYTEIGLLWQNVGRRVALWMPAVTVPQVILLGWLFNALLHSRA